MHNLASPSSALAQYGEAANVPLIKSPSLRVPKVVQMPLDIHPLPDSVSAYFVYPFTLEPHILTLEAHRQATMQAHAAHRAAFLQARAERKQIEERQREEARKRREQEEENKRREALRKVAPGFEPSQTLVPKRLSTVPAAPAAPAPAVTTATTTSSLFPPPPQPIVQRDVMADLVDQLAALDAAHSTNDGKFHLS